MARKILTNIIVNTQNDEFFISVATKGIHSFVTAGVMLNGQPLMLARVGKTNKVDPCFKTDDDGNMTLGSNCGLIFKQLFGQAKSTLQYEPLELSGEVSYAAYAITYDQYLQFTRLVSQTKGEEPIAAYLPNPDFAAGEAEVALRIANLPTLPPSQENSRTESLAKKSKQLSARNTCRHTAIDLIEHTQGNIPLTTKVSRSFFRDLPLKTNFTGGEPDNHFYVFPLPPNSYHAGKKQTAQLTKIYKRMEALLEKDPYGENTIAKFNALKTLYNNQAGLLASNNLEAALENIQQWKAANNTIINTLRAQSFFGKLFTRQSSTAALADEFEKEIRKELRKAQGA